jgi:hypothetical protein
VWREASVRRRRVLRRVHLTAVVVVRRSASAV